ncbi:MAG TPA: ribosome biogenesis GTPase YlqF [Clostridiales bacterium]|jgi:ribosome biogenesis GTPase A|nr:ribosome biogenesis GTPase YlqF [Clostridiales bacterium]
MQIQWYPGHMTKAKRMLAENLKLIDVVIELLDARAPMSTKNPDFSDMFINKKRVVLLNKSDLADEKITAEWIRYFKAQGIFASEFVATKPNKRKSAIMAIEDAAREKVESMRKKGVFKTVRAMVVGIPNVGKSSFINIMAGASRAQTGDRPGVTQGKQWVKITNQLELMDTPGLLWPKFEDETVAKHISFIGSVRDEVIDIEELAKQLLITLLQLAPESVFARYKSLNPDTPHEQLLEAVAQSRGFILGKGEFDTMRSAKIVLDEFRGGKIAKVSLEAPPKE